MGWAAEMRIRLAGYDRPARLASRTTRTPLNNANRTAPSGGH